MTIQLTQIPALDRSVGQSRVSAARAAAARASAYRKQAEAEDSTPTRVYEEKPRLTGRYTDPVNVTPIDQPGMFEGIVENLLRRLI